MFASIGLVAVVLVVIWIVGMLISWNVIGDYEPKTGNVAGGIISWGFWFVVMKIGGTVFWPLALVVKILTFLRDRGIIEEK